ncbi:hypothetical protein CVN86_22065 [Salmonella enterica]|nr:hypothetical protein [Salmonella enterica]
MKNNNIILSVAVVGCLIFSGLTFASFERPERVKFEPVPLPPSSAVPEQITTNVLLRQILAEVIKANSVNPGYIVSADKKTLRCDIGNGYPEWVEDKA